MDQKVGVKKENYPWNYNSALEKVQILNLIDFLPMKKTKKTAREKIKSGREKSENWAKKWAWKRKTAREKIKKGQK